MDTIDKERRLPSASSPVVVDKTPSSPLARMYLVTELGRRGRMMQRLASHERRSNSRRPR
jgi:hypothetical protein